MKDDFFEKTRCERCRNNLDCRIQSWFTEEVICMQCSSKEDEIKEQLKKLGFDDHEGCGYIPNIAAKMKKTN